MNLSERLEILLGLDFFGDSTAAGMLISEVKELEARLKAVEDYLQIVKSNFDDVKTNLSSDCRGCLEDFIEEFDKVLGENPDCKEST